MFSAASLLLAFGIPLSLSAPWRAAPSPSEAAAVAAPDAARSDGLSDLAARLVPEFEALADWCKEKKLAGSRQAAYEALIAWDPNHAAARRALGWRSDRAGGWKRSRPARSKRDRKGLESELAARRSAIVEIGLAAIESQPDAFAGGATHTAWSRLIMIDPEHAGLRASLGQTKYRDPALGPDAKSRWMRTDVVQALQRGARRKEFVLQQLDAVPATETLTSEALDRSVNTCGVRWNTSLQLPGARVVGTVTATEAQDIAEHVHITPAVMGEFLPPPATPLKSWDGYLPQGDQGGPDRPPWWSRPRFLVVTSTRDRDCLIDGVGGALAPRRREWLRQLNTGVLDDRNTIFVWTPGESDRRESAVRQRVGLYLRRTYAVSSSQGWIWEGIGLLYSGSIAGTKNVVWAKLKPKGGTVAGGGSRANDRDLRRPQADWLAMARDLFRDRPQRNLGILLGKDVESMSEVDLLLAYALGTYIVDGHSDKAPSILSRIGADQPAITVLEDELGLKLPEIGADLAAWLEEMRPSPRGTTPE